MSLAMAPGAGAAGYDFAGTFATGAKAVGGINVDPTTTKTYVAVPNNGGFTSGWIAQFDCSEVLANETCEAGFPATFAKEKGFIGSIALNSSGNVDAVYLNLKTFKAELSSFDPSTGEVLAGFPFVPTLAGSPGQIAVDSSDSIFVPDQGDQTIKVFDPSTAEPETAVETIDCEALSCPGGAFNEPTAVAIDSSDNLYVADKGNERIVKIPATGTPSVPISGVVPQAVAVNNANGNIFVGGDDGDGFHVTEYTGAGVEVAEFGTGIFEDKVALDGLAVDSATGNVYVTDTVSLGETTSGLVLIFSPSTATPPTPTTTPATALTQTAATLNGTVNPNEGGAITSCEFEWGTTTAYTGGSILCAENPSDGNEAVPVKGSLSGLSPSTAYHYQLVTDNGSGAVKGGDQEFKTLPPAPTATTEAATAITQAAASLNAKINANGSDAECSFEYGTTTAYGASVPCSTNPVKGTEATAVSAALASLSAGTTYHFRVVAKNAGGKAPGNDATFTTQSAPAPPAGGGGSSTPPAATPPVTTPPPTKKPLKCKKGFKKKTVKGKAKCVKVKKKHKKH